MVCPLVGCVPHLMESYQMVYIEGINQPWWILRELNNHEDGAYIFPSPAIKIRIRMVGSKIKVVSRDTKKGAKSLGWIRLCPTRGHSDIIIIMISTMVTSSKCIKFGNRKTSYKNMFLKRNKRGRGIKYPRGSVHSFFIRNLTTGDDLKSFFTFR